MTTPRPWPEVRSQFRNYYITAPYYKPGADWNFYAAAYHFGWQAARDERYSDCPWQTVEPNLSRAWRSQPSMRTSWEVVAPAVRDAWEKAQGSWGAQRPLPDRLVWSRSGHPLLR